MAHFNIEYSSNLRFELDVQALMKALHKTAVQTDVFPLGGLRLRAQMFEDYLIADGDTEHAFVHVSVDMGHGRPLDVRKDVGERLFKTLCEFLAPVYNSRTMGISLEIAELNPDLNFKTNNIHRWLKEKETEQGGSD